MRRPACLAGVALALALAGASPGFADVVPGDVITPANKEKLAGLVPEDLAPFVLEDFEGLQMTIAAPGDYTPHPRYVEATVRHACQPSLDAKGNLVDYVAGEPFPFSEWAKQATAHRCDLGPDDPQFAQKLAWNVNYRWQGGSGFNYPQWGFSYMRNEGKELWRLGQGEYRRTYFSHRADLPPGSEALEAGTNVEWAEFFDVKDPFDLRGTMFLLYRYTDPAKEDDTWAYIPSLRRVRRVATTQKSDSLLGTEFTLEDFYMFSGYVLDHQWEFRGESRKLGAMNTKRSCFPRNLGGDAATRKEGMLRLGTMEEWNACKYGPYGALPFVDESWEVRNAFQLDDVPRQKGHPYSRKKIWYDKETLWPLYAITFDRGGKPYKVLAHIALWSEDSPNPINHDRRAVIGQSIMIVNVQNLNSHVTQFYTANVNPFTAEESRRYFDTTRLKTKGR
jgi:hypothetical protein